MATTSTPTTSQESTSHPEDSDLEKVVKPDAEQEDAKQLTGVALYGLLISMLLLVLLVTLDISVIATAIPRITDDFHTIKDIGWYTSAFLISQCTIQLLAGRIYTFFLFKPSFLCFFGIFELGSVLSGASQSSTMLVIARAVAGVGSAGLINGCLTITGLAAPPGKRAMAMSIMVAVSSCGQIIGPLVGGALTDGASWRWCFYINLPFGAVTMLGFLFTSLPDPRDKTKKRGVRDIFLGIDIPGFLIFAPACVILLLALQWGGTEFAWKSATIIGLFCGAALTFVVFAYWEYRQGDQAMIPFPLLSMHVIGSSCATAFFQGGTLLILTYYLAIYFQVLKDASPIRSAIYTLPNFVSQVITSIVAAVLVNQVGYLLPLLLLGGAMNTTAYGLFSTLKIDSSADHWIGYQVLAGVGRGFSLQMPILAVQAAVSRQQIATVTAIVMWSQFFGSAVSLSIAQTVFVGVLKSTIRQTVPGLDPQTVIDAGATGFPTVVPKQYLHGVRLSYDKAVANTFYLGLALAFGGFVASFGIGKMKADMKKLKSPEIPKSDTAESGKAETGSSANTTA